MLVRNIKNLLAVLAIGLFAVGCSSNQTVEDGESGSTEVTESLTSSGAVDDAGAIDSAKLNELLDALNGKKVFFDFDRSEVTSDNFDLIKLHAEYMALNKEAKLTIEGHCDERGTREYNLALGERRALAVRDALVSQGISANRIEVISFGEDRPAVAESNEKAWSQNRRAEFNY